MEVPMARQLITSSMTSRHTYCDVTSSSRCIRKLEPGSAIRVDRLSTQGEHHVKM